jgi:AcrR family transcriptional regulator
VTNDTKEMTNMKRVRRDRREEILQEASRLFGIDGFHGTSLTSIAQAVGLTEPGLLHYFPSKVSLLENVLEYRDRQDEEKYLALVQSESISLSRILDALEHLVSENQRRPGLVRLFTVLVGESIRVDHPSHDYFVNRYQRIRDIFNAYIADLDDGAIPADLDVDQLSSLIFAVMDGLQIQWLLDPEKVNMTDSFSLFTKLLHGYLVQS